MKTRIIDQSSWTDALEPLLGGGVVAIPTDTVYGIAAMPLDTAAIDAIYAAKDRPLDKALPMLVASISDAERIAELDADALRLVDAFWPGALTVVAMASRGFRSPAIAEDGSVAVRMPALDHTLRLIAAAGGVLAVTSANRSGAPPATTAAAVLEQLDGRIAAVVDAGPSPGGAASSVVRVAQGRIQMVRVGAISRSRLELALHRPAQPEPPVRLC